MFQDVGHRPVDLGIAAPGFLVGTDPDGAKIAYS